MKKLLTSILTVVLLAGMFYPVFPRKVCRVLEHTVRLHEMGKIKLSKGYYSFVYKACRW